MLSHAIVVHDIANYVSVPCYFLHSILKTIFFSGVKILFLFLQGVFDVFSLSLRIVFSLSIQRYVPIYTQEHIHTQNISFWVRFVYKRYNEKTTLKYAYAKWNLCVMPVCSALFRFRDGAKFHRAIVKLTQMKRSHPAWKWKFVFQIRRFWL